MTEERPMAPLRDAERILQITNVDPELKRAMRIEAVSRGTTLGKLLADMWRAYKQYSWEEDAEQAR